MGSSKSNIQLKQGLIKAYEFTDDFYKANKMLCNKFIKHYDKIFDGVASMYDAKQKNRHNEAIKIELVELLDKFYDLGVRIWNGFDNKTYGSKEEYRDYVINYGLDET